MTTTTPVQLAPHHRDDIRGEVAEGAGVSTREMLRLIDEEIHVSASFVGNARLKHLSAIGKLHYRDLAVWRAIRSIIATIAPCAACGHRILPIDPVGADGAALPGAVTAHPPDGAALTPSPLGVGAADIRGAR